MILGIDPGGRRFGVATGDFETGFARPLEVIDARDRDPLDRIGELVAELGASLVVVGRPTTLSGQPGAAVERQQGFVSDLRARLAVPVEEFDERLTTVSAARRLIEAGASASTRARLQDAVAAQLILQDYLDSRR